jgi:exodeoxyribonuclease VIII
MTQFLLKNKTQVILPSIVSEDYKNHWAEEGFTNEQHHSHLESVSSSSLKIIADSPYAYLAGLKDRQNGIIREETKSMAFGTLIHTILLEPEVFRKKMIMSPKFDLRTTIGKEAKKIFEMETPIDAIVLNEAEYDNVMGVVDAVINHPTACNIFKEGISERSGFYRDPETGILCRIRPDFMSTANNLSMFIDLKTSKSSEYRAFSNQIWEYRYDLQLAMYKEGIKEITGSYPDISGWVVVTNTRPFEVAIYTFDEIGIQTGKDWYHYCLRRLKKCIQSKNFPQRQIQIETMLLPDYAIAKPIPELEN